MGEMSTLSRVAREIVASSIFKQPFLCTVAISVSIMMVVSAYYTIELIDCMSNLHTYVHTPQFKAILWKFLWTSVAALCSRSFPALAYTYLLQGILRKEFCTFLKEYLNLDYAQYNSKSPGSIRYCIFMKCYCTPLCTQMIIYDFPYICGATVFSILEIRKSTTLPMLILFAGMPVIYFIVLSVIVSKRVDSQRAFLKEENKMSSTIYDKLVTYDAIKTFNLEEATSNALYTQMGRQEETQLKFSRFTVTGEYLLKYVLYIPFVFAMFALLSASGGPSMQLFVIVLIFTRMIAQLEDLTRQLFRLAFLLTQVEYTEIEKPETGHVPREDLESFNSTIEFKNLTLMYAGTPIISNINAVIKKGEKIAIVGPNGTGKSTLAKVLLGFTEFQGEIFFDNRNVNSITWKSIIRQISYVPQNDNTSDDTIMNNLRLGDPNASDEAIIEKARLFGAHEIFEALPLGYETPAGPRGNNLSGGQLQKVSLVRAAVKNAPIFVLDEATAAMDKGYENDLIERLFSVLSDRTLIMIVHGCEHLGRFDNILFLNEGTLEQVGSYEELMNTNQNFKNFVTLVAQNEE